MTDARDAFDSADDIKLVNLSLSRAANLLPWKSLCLSRSIAAFIMLRRRGIPAVMFAGVKFAEDSSLLAHAWVARWSWRARWELREFCLYRSGEDRTRTADR